MKRQRGQGERERVIEREEKNKEEESLDYISKKIGVARMVKRRINETERERGRERGQGV